MLPELFKERMQRMLGEEYGAFLESFGEARCQALRLNALKKGVDGCSAAIRYSTKGGSNAADFAHLTKVPWTEDGYYYQADDRPGKHPLHEAGVYYIQEPSAMAPAELLDVKPGERVLDLCAAPGGKSTQIAAKMQGKGILVCNEIHLARAKILSENIERMGICNAIVTNEAPERLAEFFPVYFDKILVDAPCSGEGMFRKNEEACEEWSLENVALCAERQDGILDYAAGMLRPGGKLVYSTCTFAPEEDEGSISRFLCRHGEFTVLPIEKEQLGLAGCDGAAKYLGYGESGEAGYTVEKMSGEAEHIVGKVFDEAGHTVGKVSDEAGCIGEKILGETMRIGGKMSSETMCIRGEMRAEAVYKRDEMTSERAVMEVSAGLGSTLRIWPHRVRGEGHFAALLHKEGEIAADFQNVEGNEAGASNPEFPVKEIPENLKVVVKEEMLGNPRAVVEEKMSGNPKAFMKEEMSRNSKALMKEMSGNSKAQMKEVPRNSKAFMKEMSRKPKVSGKEMSRNLKYSAKGALGKPDKELEPLFSFCNENLSFSRLSAKVEYGEGIFSEIGTAVGMGAEVRTVRFGEHIYLVPAGAPSLDGLKVLRPGLHLGELKKNRFEPSHALALALPPEYATHTWELDSRDALIESYLKGQTFPAEGEKGWYLICVDGFSIGWGKLAGGIMKNHYPIGLRRKDFKES